VTDVDGVRSIYAACAARLVSQVYALTGDFAEAQDVVQEAFARALVRQRRFAQLDNPEAWLRTVAINLVRSYGRRRAVLDRLVRSGRVDLPGRVVPGLSPDHVAVVAALQRLPRPVREAVVLHHLADLPVAEVAATLGCSVSAAKMRLRRGRQVLAELLDEHAGRELHNA
jgi:DNA-directed RNA polymerase specialized sigma24 family protein